jgi:hypothetical protein
MLFSIIPYLRFPTLGASQNELVHKNFLLSLLQQGPKSIRFTKKSWEELIAYVPLTQYGPRRNLRLQQFFFAAGTCLPSCCLATRGDTQIYLQTLLCYDTHASNNFSIVAYIPCRKNVFTEALPNNGKGDTYTDRQTDGRDLWSTLLTCVFESWWERSHTYRYRHRHRQQGDHISRLLLLIWVQVRGRDDVCTRQWKVRYFVRKSVSTGWQQSSFACERVFSCKSIARKWWETNQGNGVTHRTECSGWWWLRSARLTQFLITTLSSPSSSSYSEQACLRTTAQTGSLLRALRL